MRVVFGPKAKMGPTTPTVLVICLAIFGLVNGTLATSTFVRLPRTYTAMKGDIPVTFRIVNFVNLTSTVMVHLSYLPSDSYLQLLRRRSSDGRRRSNMEAVTVASLAVPLGVRDGTVVFPCGSVVRAGPHAAKITIDGNVVAISDVLEVAWPR